MSDLVDLERRITSALERIGRGVEALQGADTDSEDGETAALQSALEDERTANAQLNERVLALKEKQDSTIAALEAEVEALKLRADAAELAVSKLTATNDALRGNNTALREANEAGNAEPHLINKAMQEELEALRASRAADRVEMDAILAELKEIVEGEAHA